MSKKSVIGTMWRQLPDGRYQALLSIDGEVTELPGFFDTEQECTDMLTKYEKQLLSQFGAEPLFLQR